MSLNQKIEHVTVKNFKTTDGKMFNDLVAAQQHQKALEEADLKAQKEEKVKTQVKDLLNQIILVTKDQPDDGSFLSNVHLYAKRVTTSEWEADNYETQYNNSNCY